MHVHAHARPVRMAPRAPPYDQPAEYPESRCYGSWLAEQVAHHGRAGVAAPGFVPSENFKHWQQRRVREGA